MFDFFKKRRELSDARTKIGVDLHRQIFQALQENEALTSARLSSAFTPGYIFAFVTRGFMSLGVDIGRDDDKQIRFICDGVIPGRLYKIYSDQAAAYQIAGQMKDQEKKILATGLSPTEVRRSFSLGAKAGVHDAPLISIQSSPPDNMRRFLLDQQVRTQ